LLGFQDANRDATGTIQRRFASALLSCGLSAALMHWLSRPALASTRRGFSFAELLGFQTRDVGSACASCLAVTVVIFAGPLVQHLLAVHVKDAYFISSPAGGRWVAARNYVLAPFTEEFVFRACLVRLWVEAGFSQPLIIFASPFCFAMAHTHHFVEHVRRLGHRRTALLQVAFQVFYTSLFGMYSNFLLLRTGSTVAVILTHTFCNHQGFPDLGFASRSHPLHQYRMFLGALYVAGVSAFCYLLYPWTEGFDSSFVVPGSAA